MAKDVTFIFHGEWYEHIKTIPLESQSKIIMDITRYGAELPLLYENDTDAHYCMAMSFLKPLVDKSKEYYNEKKIKAQSAGRKKVARDELIWQYAREGKKADEIAELLNLGVSTVQHNEGWKRRKEAFL